MVNFVKNKKYLDFNQLLYAKIILKGRGEKSLNRKMLGGK